MTDRQDDRYDSLEFPPLRRFEVMRWVTEEGVEKFRREHIDAHAVQHTGKGNVLLFLDYRVVQRFKEDLTLGETIALEVHHFINGYETVREVSAPQATRLIH